eukprot:9145745-Ditylum_brightwellii.AAC.1
MAVVIIITSTMGLVIIPLMSATSPWLIAKSTQAMTAKKGPATAGRCTSAATGPGHVSSHPTRVRI